MSILNSRLKELRKSVNLTQTEFADKLGLAQNSIASYESGRRTPNEAIVKSICREFNVNQDWLVNGNGSMFVELSREEEITKYIAELVKDDDEMKEFQRKFIRILSRLSIDDWKMIEKFVEELAKKD